MNTVYITGASGSIGRAAAETFAAEGYAVALGYYRREEETRAFCKQLASRYQVPALPVGGDLRSSSHCAQAAETVLGEFGHLDVLVLNAGTAQWQLLTETPDETWRSLIGLHLDSAFYLCKAILPSMIARHSGRILAVSSMWGQVGASMEVAYSAAKAGLIGFVKALAQEVGPSGICVNTVSPGVIDTPMNQIHGEEALAALREETPLCRLGTPEDVARALLFLAGPGGDFITGQVLAVNGGMIL